jgi:WD40-like Beta Propeller Repeat
MVTRSSKATWRRLVAGILYTAALVSTGCGFYRHHRTADNIVAISWELDGSPVSLGQEVTYKSGFVGMSPHTVDPSYDLGPLVVSRPDGRRAVVAGFDSWWQIKWALSRGPGKGFVLTVTKGGPEDRQSACLLIDSAARRTPCPTAVDASSEYAYVIPGSDQLVFWKSYRTDNARAVNLQTGEELPAASLSAHLALVSDKGTDMSLSALAPEGTTWAVAFPGRGKPGIWRIEESAEPKLLVPFASGAMPPFPRLGDDSGVRLFSQMYGLAWAPDGKQIYWCGQGPQGLIASLGDGSSREVTPCLTEATWSPDGRRIAGLDEKGNVRVWTVQ